MSLRELPPDQEVKSSRAWWARFRYVPLVALVVLSSIAAATGFVVDREIEDAPPLPNDPAAISGEPDTATAALPDECAPTVDPPAHEMWLEGQADDAEAVWDAHAAELEKDYVLGEDGWVFWNDLQAMNFSQGVGRRVLSEEEAAAWHDYLAKMRDSLAAQGIPFYIVIGPAKWSIYDDQLPAWAQEIRGSGPLDQLRHLYPDLPIVDVRQPLRTESATNQVFSRVNSHWTDYGAYVGWKTVAECMNDVSPELGHFEAAPITGIATPQDYDEFAPYGISNTTGPDWTVPIYAEPLSPVTVIGSDGTATVVAGEKPTDLSLLPVETRTEDPQTESTALILRDSMGNGLSVPFQQAFSRTWQVRHNFDFPDQLPDVDELVAQHQPDVVILQMAQRHLTFAPTGD